MSLRRMPTKAELLRLQKLYRTDKRIAEVLGNGVTEHLVAYWRRKKGIPIYSFPKFSDKEIREVWDRFGDDFHAGMELGISKAAFYNWRRRYKITQKPAALKLEQLSLELFTDDTSGRRKQGTGRQTICRKILAHKNGLKEVEPGQQVEIEPEIIIAAGNAGKVLDSFNKCGTTYVNNPARLIIPLDEIPSPDKRQSVVGNKSVRDFVRLQKINNFFDIGEGSGLQATVEKGLVLPGQVVLGSDQSVAACGSLGAATFAVSAEEMAGVWAEGKLQITIPETIRIILSGRLPRGVFVRDVAHYLVSQLHGRKVENKNIECYGSAIEQMSISERFTLCTVLAGLNVAGVICPFDPTTRRYINPRARKPFTPILADRNAVYAAEYTFDLNTMKPLACRLDKLEKISPVAEMSGVTIQSVFIGGAANGRFDDLRIVADIVKGKKINLQVRLFIQPASRTVYLESLKRGLVRVFAEAGAIVLSPGDWRGPVNSELLAPEEQGLTTIFNPASSSTAGLYQVSPATAAVSALTGQITSPVNYVKI